MISIATSVLERKDIARLATIALFGLCAIAASAYVFFIVHSVVDVVLRKEYMLDTARMREKVSVMEATYLAENRALTEETAHELGLAPIQEKRFVRAEGGLSLNR